MAVTYGFYNAVKASDGTYDRVYNSEQISDMFEGLVTSGVYESVDDALIVKENTGMNITVGAGRAVMSDGKWMKNDATLTITLNAAHLTLPRYSAIVIREDKGNRKIEIVEKAGAAASTPEKPVLTNNYLFEEKCLAYVYVGAGAKTITQMNIQDVRADGNLCGWVTGLVKQVDTTELFLQYQEAYDEQLSSMIEWQANQKAAFDAWYSTLTETLQVSAHLKEYKKSMELTENQSVFTLDMSGYTYEATDVIRVSVNGMGLLQEYEWVLDISKTPAEIHTSEEMEAGNLIEIAVLKAELG